MSSEAVVGEPSGQWWVVLPISSDRTYIIHNYSNPIDIELKLIEVSSG
jgi:hypothetical protein